MKLQPVLTAILALVCHSAVAGTSSPSAAERKRLVGTWRGHLANESENTIELVITPQTITGRNLKNGESLGEGTYELDPVTKSLDAHGIANPVNGKNYLGIYSLEGKTLKWCSNSGSRKRPSKLASNGSNFLMILQRE